MAKQVLQYEISMDTARARGQLRRLAWERFGPALTLAVALLNVVALVLLTIAVRAW